MKYLTQAIILKLKEYEKGGRVFSHFINDKYVSNLDPDAKLPVLLAMLHKQASGPFADVMRVVIGVPMDGKSGQTEEATVDMPVADYAALPQMD